MAPSAHRVALAAAAGAAVVDAAQLVSQKRGCGKIRMGRKHFKVKNPGAGLSSVTPFVESYHDGYMMIGCVKDDMLLHADKFGDGKFSYKMGDVSNVSIVHYSEVVASEDAEPMTHSVCFDFCRSLPEMGFFGINNGRDCYCTPYYKQIAGDSSDCDAVCDGNPGTMCGGKTKSSIFSMHACNDAAQNLAAASEAALKQQSALESQATKVTDVSAQIMDASSSLQKAFGMVGDSVITAQIQDAKVWAGELEHAADAGAALVQSVGEVDTEAAGTTGGTTPEMEKATAALNEATAKAKGSEEELAELAEQVFPPESDANASSLYYPVMYFVDKEFKDMPSTCGGDAVGKTVYSDFEGCAEACEKTAGKCQAFTWLSAPDGGLCFMLSKVKSTTYYTGCGAAKFLQQKKSTTATEAKCVVKFSDFDGTTLKPDASGKCKQCLKEAKKADRCFGA
eukprot:TRINITY_DN2410_c0_g2_i1.p2 TRINITY_DN2410_c0_g2~~TRINITY_DN2410_c0_g2_i1.p2  ORF type:complete len:452 (-),score=177.56 TRINITY_DN2410_c0_g2_i1:60-1415(-)